MRRAASPAANIAALAAAIVRSAAPTITMGRAANIAPNAIKNTGAMADTITSGEMSVRDMRSVRRPSANGHVATTATSRRRNGRTASGPAHRKAARNGAVAGLAEAVAAAEQPS